MLTSVIVPVKNRADMSARFIYSFREYHSDDIELVFVNDGSTDGTKVLLEHMGVTRYNSDVSKGFPSSCNIGASIAQGDFYIFVNNDVLISGNFVTPVLQAYQKDPDRLIGAELLEQDTGWNRFGELIVPYIPGWFMACSVEMFEDLGGFDEAYSPGDFEDVDFSYSAIQRGYRLCKVSVPIKHIGGQSFGYTPERRERTLRNRLYFKEKWGL